MQPTAAYGRRTVEGGAPYLYERGLPQYPPDEYDTCETYPLMATVLAAFTGSPATWTHHSEETAVSLIAPRLNLHEPLADCDTSRTYAGVEGAWRACGVIERAWYNYAIQSLDPKESLTAAHAEDEGYFYKPPPFRFWVPSPVWAPSR